MMYSEKDVVARVEGLTLRTLRVWVAEGWVLPVRGDSGLNFRDVDIARVRLIRQLQDEMNVNEDSLPIVLSLVDQVYSLRREMRELLEAVESQPADVKDRFAQNLKRY